MVFQYSRTRTISKRQAKSTFDGPKSGTSLWQQQNGHGPWAIALEKTAGAVILRKDHKTVVLRKRPPQPSHCEEVVVGAVLGLCGGG